MSSTLRIGCAAGFWGDSDLGTTQLVREAVDVIVYDYLSEITMALLARAKARDPRAGYVPDFVTAVAPHLAAIHSKGIRLITNAGGLNPHACAQAFEAAAAVAGLTFDVAVVTGDDLAPYAEQFRAEGAVEMFTGSAFPERPRSANAYLGAPAIAAALDRGAQVVITGRCADSALALGPLVHAYRWPWDDWDRLAQGSLVGHLLECGPQATGGIFTDWRSVPDWENIGYPIAECAADGSAVITKPEGSGGLVTALSVAEQLVYEIGDPGDYRLPDVICDFRNVRLTQESANRVRVAGARGRAAPDSYKVSVTCEDGFRLVATLMIGGREARDKALRVGAAVLERARRAAAARGLDDFAETSIEPIGSECTYGPHARAGDTREVVLKIAARHARREALELLAREIFPSATSMAQGITGAAGGRPSPSPVVRHLSFLVPKHRVKVEVHARGERFEVAVPAGVPPASGPRASDAVADPARESTVRTPLWAIAVARSGDKGNVANIGVVARSPAAYATLVAELTAERVADYLAHLGTSRVERFRLDGIGALNFVLADALAGGGIASLRYDAQGKALGQMLLDIEIDVARAEGVSR